MILNSIRLVNFRSYKDESFEFDPGVNIIVGPNASGKTNLLESILVVSRGKSYRVGDKELITFNEEWLRLESLVNGDTNRTVKVSVSGEKRLGINDKEYKRFMPSQTIPVVLFEPNHLMLLHGQPEFRRSYLDDILEYYDKDFYSARRHYKRVLLQRNSLLKSGQANIKSLIFVWDVRLSELGGYIFSKRTELINRLNVEIGDIYSYVAGKETKVKVIYGSSLDVRNYETSMLKKLELDLDKDIARGYTGCGIHRDDYSVEINEQKVSESASRGETRTTLLALKIFEIKLLKEKHETDPIVLLDDVFSELDGSRRQALTAFIRDYQVFITTTDADVVGHDFAQKANLIAL